MDILWKSHDPIKPSEVQKNIKSDYAYTTIMTVLKRLSDKKLVSRTKQGNTYFYSAIDDKQTFACSCLEDLFSRLIYSYGDFAISSFKKVAIKSGLSL
jgi:predicted transcriptional regulator